MPPPPPPASQPPPPDISTILAGSTQGKVALATAALSLRHEQVQAQVRYYGADQETNAELDKITDTVVAELRAMRMADEIQRESLVPDVEIELIQSLRDLLERLFSPRRHKFIERKIRDIQRRITQSFFNSELYAQLAREAGEVPAASWPEQALYYAIKRQEAALLEELANIPVETPEVRDRAVDRLHAFSRQLCTDFLSRSTPELERLLGIYREVLSEFFLSKFQTVLPELCWTVIKESRVAVDHRLGYKIAAERFGPFRVAFDKHFLENLVFHVQAPLMKRAPAGSGEFRDATVRFVANPLIYTQICGVINDAIYDYLHGEGYLDLPADYRIAFRED